MPTASKSSRRIEFDPQRQLDFLRRQGQYITYRKSYRCACFDEDSQNKDITCSACDVDGYRYECDIPSMAIITGIQDKQAFTQIGRLKQGDCIGGFPWQIPIKFHDEVILKNKKAYRDALLVQDEDDPAQIKDYRVCQLEPARTINRVFVPYKDFKIADDGQTVEWLTSNRPEDGEKFTLGFWVLPTYIVWRDEALERWSENKQQLKHVILRLKDEWGGIKGTP